MIRKTVKFLFIFLIILGIIGFQYYFLRQFYIKSEMVSDIITFLSVVFGFYLSSLAIFVTSRYVSDLYKIVDANNPAQTLLHLLIKRYEIGLNILLISILYFIFIQYKVSNSDNGKILLSNNSLTPFLSILAINFAYSYWMLSGLAKIVIQEAKRLSNK